MDFELTPEEAELRQTVRDFVETELFPWEQVLLDREIVGGPPELTRAELSELQERAKKSGLWAVDMPAAYDGAELSTTMVALMNMELGRTFVNFRFGGSATLPDLLILDEEQQQRFVWPVVRGESKCAFALTEPQSGSDARNMRTTAVRQGDDWIINGEKTWISYGHEADVALVFARTSQEGDPDGVTLFIVERSRGWTSRPIPVLGTMTCASLSFVDVVVPDENRVGEVNNGFGMAMRNMHRVRASVQTALNIGAAERLLELSIAYAKERITFGLPLADRQSIQHMLAESDVELRGAKILVLLAAAKLDRGRDARHDAAVAKISAARTANRIVDRAMQIHGAMGFSRELPIQRWYRNLRIERIWEGSDEMMLDSIKRELLSGSVKPGRL